MCKVQYLVLLFLLNSIVTIAENMVYNAHSHHNNRDNVALCHLMAM